MANYIDWFFIIYALLIVLIMTPVAIWRRREWKKYELRAFVLFLEKIKCKSCNGSGGIWAEDGEFIDICEDCESYGYLWYSFDYSIPRWIRKKYGRLITESIYVKELQDYKEAGNG